MSTIPFDEKIDDLLGSLLYDEKGKKSEAVEIYESLCDLMEYKNYEDFNKKKEDICNLAKKSKLENITLVREKWPYCRSLCNCLGNLIENKLDIFYKVINAVSTDINTLVTAQSTICQKIIDYYNEKIQNNENPEKLDYDELNKKIGLTENLFARATDGNYGGYKSECFDLQNKGLTCLNDGVNNKVDCIHFATL